MLPKNVRETISDIIRPDFSPQEKKEERKGKEQKMGNEIKRNRRKNAFLQIV